jgi:DNA-binding XRE family transcriptional regulator
LLTALHHRISVVITPKCTAKLVTEFSRFDAQRKNKNKDDNPYDPPDYAMPPAASASASVTARAGGLGHPSHRTILYFVHIDHSMIVDNATFTFHHYTLYLELAGDNTMATKEKHSAAIRASFLSVLGLGVAQSAEDSSKKCINDHRAAYARARHAKTTKIFSNHLRQFGRRIRTLREEAGFNQDRFAQKMAMKPSSLSRFENGHTFPSINTHFQMAQALGMTLSEFIRQTWDMILYPAPAGD